MSKYKELLKRQREIQKEIMRLNKEAMTINKQLSKYPKKKKKSGDKVALLKKLASLGFDIISYKKLDSQVFEISEAGQKFRFLFMPSEFHDHPVYNALYTFKPGMNDRVDFILLAYETADEAIHYLVLKQDKFSSFVSDIPLNDQLEKEIKIQADHKKARLIDLNLDLSDFINNYAIIQLVSDGDAK